MPPRASDFNSTYFPNWRGKRSDMDGHDPNNDRNDPGNVRQDPGQVRGRSRRWWERSRPRREAPASPVSRADVDVATRRLGPQGGQAGLVGHGRKYPKQGRQRPGQNGDRPVARGGGTGRGVSAGGGGGRRRHRIEQPRQRPRCQVPDGRIPVVRHGLRQQAGTSLSAWSAPLANANRGARPSPSAARARAMGSPANRASWGAP